MNRHTPPGPTSTMLKIILKTERLTIREFTLDDAQDMAAVLGDAEVMRFSLAGPLDHEGILDYLQRNMLDHYAKYGYGLWALVHNDEVIGYAGLIQQEIEGKSYPELGYRLAKKYWGQGLATEAGKAILDYAFTELSLNQVISIIEPANDRSLAVAKRLGMTHMMSWDYKGVPVEIFQLSSD